MGYARYTLPDGREAGYTVPDVCNERGCTARIDRGLDYLCGETPGGQSDACGLYFCHRHLHWSDVAGHRCRWCITAYPDLDYDGEIVL